MPYVAWWAWRQERRAARSGQPLPEQILKFAQWLGIRQAERIRVVLVPRIPFPGAAWMHRLAARIGFDRDGICGLCLRYGIFLTEAPEAALESTLRHELVHTQQYERCGSLAGFLRRYLVQCLCDGYGDAALEAEARSRSCQAPPAFR